MLYVNVCFSSTIANDLCNRSSPNLRRQSRRSGRLSVGTFPTSAVDKGPQSKIQVENIFHLFSVASVKCMWT